MTERTAAGSRPLAGVSIGAWVVTDGFSYSYHWANGAVGTDAEGRYQLTKAPGSVRRVFLEIYKDGYLQQCAAPPVETPGDVVVNMEMVPVTALWTKATALPPAPGFRLISGRVYEETDTGRSSLPGALVSYQHGLDSFGATTIADSNGDYLLCGIPDDRTVELIAYKRGVKDSLGKAAPGQSSGVDLFLR